MSNNYTGLRRLTGAEGARCAARLLKMRETLQPLRRRKSESSLLLATWNIRDFDSNKFGFGPRLPESFFYIAEIMSCFDLVAVQEVSEDLAALEAVTKILGREWDYIVTDVTEGPGGNGERMAFVYNTEKVYFRRIAGEVVLPDGQLIVSRKKAKKAATESATDVAASAEESGIVEVKQQFARTPFVVAFQSGWFRFNLCTVHIYYGSDSGEQLKRRIAEIERLVEFFAKRQDKENKKIKNDPVRAQNYILLGDFNVVSPEHKTMQALKGHGFKVPAPIDGDKVRDEDQHFYDQIAVRVADKRFRVTTGGIVDMFADVFRNNAEDRALYASFVPKSDPEKNETFRAKSPEALFAKWRTWQMSDHAPLWIEVDTDFSDDYLKQFAG